MSAIDKLVGVGSSPIRSEHGNIIQLVADFNEKTLKQLQRLLRLKNGFYAFEGALHVFSDLGSNYEKGILDWNREDLWRGDYQEMANDAIFFAEDIFGTQFCIRKGAISTFNPETGTFESIAADVDEWAQLILDDYALWTGHIVAHDWQAKYGALPAGSRLVPVTPFVLGGEYITDNLKAIEAVKGMRYRASIAVQIRDVPDGTSINLRLIE